MSTRAARIVAALQPGCEEMKREWGNEEEMERKWWNGEEMEIEWGNWVRFTLHISSFSLHFLSVSSSFPHSLFISSQPGCKAATIRAALGSGAAKNTFPATRLVGRTSNMISSFRKESPHFFSIQLKQSKDLNYQIACNSIDSMAKSWLDLLGFILHMNAKFISVLRVRDAFIYVLAEFVR